MLSATLTLSCLSCGAHTPVVTLTTAAPPLPDGVLSLADLASKRVDPNAEIHKEAGLDAAQRKLLHRGRPLVGLDLPVSLPIVPPMEVRVVRAYKPRAHVVGPEGAPGTQPPPPPPPPACPREAEGEGI